ncbi:MAG: AbrB family transcriptional regulator [Comamonadaceae bacterium]|nr:AbrB family transcriptional regulator [Comamonadaceae bacterium]
MIVNRFPSLRPAGHWLLLCAGSGALAVLLAVRGVQLALPAWGFNAGQALLGCLMAQSLQPRQLAAVWAHAPLFLGATLLLIGASTVLGWWLMRRQVMPGSTALWGMTPGASAAMVVLAGQYGADMRLVAFMQYTRLLLITLVAALVSRAVLGDAAVGATAAAPAASAWWGQPSAAGLGWTAALVLLGTLLAPRLRLAGGAMVLPLLGAVLLQNLWGQAPALPPALLWLSYASLGWSVGLRFTHAILRHALRTLPQVLLCTLLLMLVGLATGAVLHWATGLDALSAFLATCPGGADSMAVIVAGSAVDTGFVMAMQLARFLLVLLIGPALTQRVARACRL